MPPILRCVARHHHLVTEPRRDLVVAPGAAVRLHRLEGVHVADLDRALGYFSAVRHLRFVASAEDGPGNQCDHHDQRGDDDHDVAATLGLGAEGVEAHTATVAPCLTCSSTVARVW